MSKDIRVLVVDDDSTYLELVERNLRSFGFEVTTSTSSLGVSNLIRSNGPDVVLLDVNIPALSGDAVLEVARRQAPSKTRFILFSSSDEASLRKVANDSGADGYITKSADAEQLASYLKSCAS